MLDYVCVINFRIIIIICPLVLHSPGDRKLTKCRSVSGMVTTGTQKQSTSWSDIQHWNALLLLLLLKYQTPVVPVGDAGDAAVEVFRAVKQLLTQNIHVGSASSHVVWNHRHEVLCRAEIYTPAALHRSAPKLHTKINSYLVQNCADIRKRAYQQLSVFRLTLWSPKSSYGYTSNIQRHKGTYHF